MQKFDRKLILEDGSEYYGYGFGCMEDRITEIVFNTSPVGYQEIVSDPSYTYQTVVMAYPYNRIRIHSIHYHLPESVFYQIFA